MKHKLPATSAEWNRHAAQIRRALPDLLWGGKPPVRPKPSFKVIASGKAVEKWQQRRWAELDRLYPTDRKAYGGILQYKWQGPVTWTTQVIEYSAWPGHPPQRAILRIPNKAKRAPALLCLHGHSRGLQLGCVEVRYFAEPLTAMGFVTLAPDAMPFGDRRIHLNDGYEADFRGFLFWDERAVASECWLLGQSLIGRQIWELMASVDLLQSLPQVDPKRIGTIGCSQGGFQSWWLSAMDQRIAAAAASAGVSTYRSWIKKRVLNALVCYVPGILRVADQEELIGLIAPRPLFLLDCANDIFFPREGIDSVARFVAKVYGWKGASRCFRHDLDPGGHGFPKRQRKLAIDWLRERLMR